MSFGPLLAGEFWATIFIGPRQVKQSTSNKPSVLTIINKTSSVLQSFLLQCTIGVGLKKDEVSSILSGSQYRKRRRRRRGDVVVCALGAIQIIRHTLLANFRPPCVIW
jgi:hypothetical protein